MFISYKEVLKEILLGDNNFDKCLIWNFSFYFEFEM